MTAIAHTATGARQPALPRSLAMKMAGTEYQRFADQLRMLEPADWARPTACPAWDVRDVACHVLGMAEMIASPLEQARQMTKAKRAGGLFIDALTALQVAKHRHRAPADILSRVAAVGPKAARGRRLTPAVVRRMTMKDQPIDETGSTTEDWTLGYLVDIILTRDTWMHRSDIARATGRPMLLTPEHDGALVADVAAEWAERHSGPCALTLSGPAGGSWSWDGGGESYELAAEDFCRVVSGRGTGDGLLKTRVPF